MARRTVAALIGSALLTMTVVAACSAIPHRGDSTLPMTDSAIAARVTSKLTQTPGMENTRLTATSYDGAVQLMGTVRSNDQWLLAAKSAREVEGVRQVTNSLRIGAEAERQPLRIAQE